MTNSTPRAPRKPSNKFDSVRQSAAVDSAAAPQPDRDELSKRIDDLEVVLEAVGRSQKYADEFAAYCSSMRRDAEALTLIRWLALGFAAIMMIVFVGAVCQLVFLSNQWFWVFGSSWRSAEVVALVAGAVALMIVILRGAFRTISERNQDDIVPEHLKVLFDAAKQAMGIN